jgi:hypothetical protein
MIDAQIVDLADGITVGGLILTQDGSPYEHPEGFTTEVSINGLSWGNPEATVASVFSGLADGELAQVSGWGNRTPAFRIRISAETWAGLTAGEKALEAVTGRPVELVVQPPDPDAEPTVFDVLWAQPELLFDAKDELRLRHVYALSFTALPWARSAVKVITPAVATTGETVINDGSSTVGWSSTNGVVTTSGNTVISTYNAGGASGTNLRLGVNVDPAAGRYISVDWYSSVAVKTRRLYRSGGGRALIEVLREPGDTVGYTRTHYYAPGDGLTGFTFVTTHAPTSGSQTLRIDRVAQSASLPTLGTSSQKVAMVDPGGNRPGLGDVLVEHPTEGLGIVAIHSHPIFNGYTPTLRKWLIDSDTVTETPSSVSGSVHSLTGLTRFHVPADSVPSGDTQLWALLRLSSGTPGDVTVFYSAWSLMGSTVLGDPQAGTTRINFPVAWDWVLAPIARLTLPPTGLGPAGRVYIDLQRDASSTREIQMGEGYLFAMDRGTLTVVDCGRGAPSVGTAHNRLRVSAPSLESPNGSIEVATAADWSDAHTPPIVKVLCDQTSHTFEQDGSAVLTVTEGARDADTSFEHYRRSRYYVGPD